MCNSSHSLEIRSCGRSNIKSDSAPISFQSLSNYDVLSVSEPANHKLSTPICGTTIGPLPVPFCHELHIVSPPLERSHQVRSQSTLSPGIPMTLWTDTPTQSPTSPPVFSPPHEDTRTSERKHSDNGCGIREWRGTWDDGEASSKRRMWYSTLLKRSCQIWKTVQQDHHDREIFI